MGTPLLLLLIALTPLSAFAEVSWNIDCGASSSYVDGNFIAWQGDDALISAGQSRTVITTDHVMSTLRVFTSGKKNCYVLQGQKGAKLFVRARFMYGNYDGKSSPPSFDIQIDGNDWATVVTNMDTTNYVYYELTYTSKGNSISLCLVQTNSNQYPFISALEVRTLGSNMYQYFSANQALNLAGRHAFGASTTIVDSYDRLWGPTILTGSQYTTVTGDALLIDTTKVVENPPQGALQNAATTSSSTAKSMKWALTGLDTVATPTYLNLYFSEVTQLDPTTDKRNFTVYVDDQLMDSTTGGISPPYESVEALYIYGIVASSNSTITLQSTNDSTLPPIINAIEVFQVINYTGYSVASSPSGGGNTPSPTSDGSTPGSTDTGSPDSSSSKKSSKLPVILGVGIPGFLLLGAFVFVMVSLHQKRQRAGMQGAAIGGGNGQGAAQNNNSTEQMIMNMGAKFGQGLVNEFRLNVEDEATGHGDPNNQNSYASPDPLLNQTR
ncbi:hypothetical protein SAY86_018162 [Trapa natans]|uniref:Malectin-like domain-containing protein n=1 Tax=Trapa natans TaxID=22666 RepID=A0AAN7LGD6_TRANT|nr:hypothetical protein SAY86_018162 [Trapa natans]